MKPTVNDLEQLSIMQDLLTENRYWTFWSGDFSIRVNVFWEGKTKWSEVVKAVKNKMLNDFPGKLRTIHEMKYERQGELKKPDITFN